MCCKPVRLLPGLVSICFAILLSPVTLSPALAESTCDPIGGKGIIKPLFDTEIRARYDGVLRYNAVELPFSHPSVDKILSWATTYIDGRNTSLFLGRLALYGTTVNDGEVIPEKYVQLRKYLLNLVSYPSSYFSLVPSDYDDYIAQALTDARKLDRMIREQEQKLTEVETEVGELLGLQKTVDELRIRQSYRELFISIATTHSRWRSVDVEVTDDANINHCANACKVYRDIWAAVKSSDSLFSFLDVPEAASVESSYHFARRIAELARSEAYKERTREARESLAQLALSREQMISEVGAALQTMASAQGYCPQGCFVEASLPVFSDAIWVEKGTLVARTSSAPGALILIPEVSEKLFTFLEADPIGSFETELQLSVQPGRQFALGSDGRIVEVGTRDSLDFSISVDTRDLRHSLGHIAIDVSAYPEVLEFFTRNWSGDPIEVTYEARITSPTGETLSVCVENRE